MIGLTGSAIAPRNASSVTSTEENPAPRSSRAVSRLTSHPPNRCFQGRCTARCTRVAYPYQWVHGWILDAACDIAGDDDRVGRWIEELESLAARMGMRELVIRAYIHRGRRGDAAAAQAARALAADIANPALRL